jgi:hypothetical protein
MNSAEGGIEMESNASEKATDTGVEALKFARDLLAREIQYRRDKQYQVFAWISSVLVAVIAGSIAIGRNESLAKNPSLKCWLCAGVGVFALWGCLWIFLHSKAERIRSRQANYLDLKLGLFSDSSYFQKPFPEPLYLDFTSCLWLHALVRGASIAVIILGLATVLTIWLTLPS